MRQPFPFMFKLIDQPLCLNQYLTFDIPEFVSFLILYAEKSRDTETLNFLILFHYKLN